MLNDWLPQGSLSTASCPDRELRKVTFLLLTSMAKVTYLLLPIT